MKNKTWKKILSIMMVIGILCSLTACMNKNDVSDESKESDSAVSESPEESDHIDSDNETSEGIPELSETETILNAMQAQINFDESTVTMPVDLEDSDAVSLFLGLDNAENIEEASVVEPMTNSVAYSIVLAKVKDNVNAQDIADQMKNGVNPSKWETATATDIVTYVKGQYVLLVMVDAETLGLKADDAVSLFDNKSSNTNDETTESENNTEENTDNT